MKIPTADSIRESIFIRKNEATDKFRQVVAKELDKMRAEMKKECRISFENKMDPFGKVEKELKDKGFIVSIDKVQQPLGNPEYYLVVRL